MPKTESDPRCNLCNAPLLWAKTVGGNNFALNREPDPGGSYFVINGTLDSVDGEIVWDGPRYQAHVATCSARVKTKEDGPGDSEKCRS